MAKTIKFNLKLDENSIRNLEQLKENFVIEEILKYYKEGLLLRWLKARNYDALATKVEAIHTDNNGEIIKELVNIFELEIDDHNIEKDIYAIKFLEEETEKLEEYKKCQFEKDKVISDYISSYNSIFEEIKENSENLSKLKAIVSNIEKNYRDLFTMDKFMYNKIKDEGLKIVFAILMNEKLRDVIIKNERIKEDFEDKYMNIEDAEYFKDDFKYFEGNIEYWKELIENDKKILILKAENIVIREPKNKDNEEEIKNKKNLFKIFNGIEIQSLSGKESFISYLEV